MQNLLFDFIEQYLPLTEEEKDALTGLDVFRAFKKGEVLLARGTCSNEGYFVLKGCIRTYYLIDGEEKTTAFYSEMEGITPHCVNDKSPSKYFISAVEDSIISVGNPEMEAKMFERFPRFETLCRILSEELITKQQLEFDEFKFLTPEKRYLNLLEKRPDLLQRVPQHQLASFLGITPPSLSRLRKRLLKKA